MNLNRQRLALVLVLTALACDDDPMEPERTRVQVLAPARVRQGDVVQLALEVIAPDGRRDTLRAEGTWRLPDSTAGVVDASGRFVAYAAGGVVRVIGASDSIADTIAITVDARDISGRFTTLGNGRVPDRFTSDLWVHGNYAYTASWGCLSACGNRLSVWDVNNPAQPALTDSVIVDARTTNDIKIRADGGLAIVTHERSSDGLNGITVIDLATDPAHPRVITRYTDGLEEGVHNLWIEGDVAYVVEDGAGGLHVLDISDAAAPVEIAHFYAGTSFVHDVYVRNGLAFVSHWDAGLIIFDVGNGLRGGSPQNPVEVSRIITQGGNVHNAWYWPERGLIFVGEEDFGTPGRVHVVDARDLAQPVEVASFFVPGAPPHNFWVDESRGILFSAWYSNGVRAIDVSGELLGELEKQGREYAFHRPAEPTRIWAPQLHNGLVFASDMDNGLWVFDFQVTQAP